MGDQPAFTRALQQAIREAATGAIVILGIAPDRPETGYGGYCLPKDKVYTRDLFGGDA